jgi:hypothetical protein
VGFRPTQTYEYFPLISKTDRAASSSACSRSIDNLAHGPGLLMEETPASESSSCLDPAQDAENTPPKPDGDAG